MGVKDEVCGRQRWPKSSSCRAHVRGQVATWENYPGRLYLRRTQATEGHILCSSARRFEQV